MPDIVSIFVLEKKKKKKKTLQLLFMTAVQWKRKMPKLTSCSFANVLLNCVFHHYYYLFLFLLLL
jgi:hypothetical protein